MKKEKEIEKEYAEFAVDCLEEGRWRLKGLIKSEIFPEKWTEEFQKLYDEICDLEDKLRDLRL